MHRFTRSGFVVVLMVFTAGMASAQVIGRSISGAEYKDFTGLINATGSTVYTVPQGKTLYVTDIILNRSILGPSSSTPDLVIIGRDAGQQVPPAVMHIFVPGYQTVCLNLISPILFRQGEKLIMRVGGDGLVEYCLVGYQR